MMNKILSKILFSVLAVLLTVEVMAQVPQGFNFQAVGRDAQGDLIANSDLGVRVSILQGTETGTAVYTETQTPTSSAVGSFQLVIGEGTSEDDFNSIDWSADNYYVKLEIDPAGGTEYEELGTTRLLSVPYALLAQDVVNGGASTQTLDSLFLATDPEFAYQRYTSFYPGYIRNSDQDGNFSTFYRTGLQYGNDADEGVFNWFSKGSMQVAHLDYPNGERATGMSPGYFYMDIYKNGSFYAPLQFGIGNDSLGGRPFFNMNSLSRLENEQGDLLSINIVQDPEGNDPTGESAEIFLQGNTSPNFQIGGQQWEDNDLANFNMYGSTSDGSGWYINNLNMSVGSDGIDQWSSISLIKSNISGQTSEETVLIDGNTGDINIAGALSQSSDERLKKDIQTLDDALAKTTKLRGVSYTWKIDEQAENPQIGLIAQEVEKVYPEFVHTDEEGMKSVNYAQMTAVLIEAVKELNAQIHDLKSENIELQAMADKQTKLENRLAQIEKLLGENDSPTLTSIRANTKK